MKFQLDRAIDRSEASIEATPTVLDGYPLIDRLTISRDITSISPDRCVVASIFAFAPYLSGQQIFPGKFSALTAELAERFFSPIWTHFSPLHPANLPIPRGSREIFLKLDGEPSSTGHELRLAPAYGHSGVKHEPNSLVVSTNALDIDILGKSSRPRSRAALAVAVLLAEDLDVATFVIGKQTAENFDLNPSVLELLNAVSIGLRVDDE